MKNMENIIYKRITTLWKVDNQLRVTYNREVSHLYETLNIFKYHYKEVEMIGNSLEEFEVFKETLDKAKEYQLGKGLFEINDILIDYFTDMKHYQSKIEIEKRYNEIKDGFGIEKNDLEHKVRIFLKAINLNIEYKPDMIYEWLYDEYENCDKNLFKKAFKLIPNYSSKVKKEALEYREELEYNYNIIQMRMTNEIMKKFENTIFTN